MATGRTHPVVQPGVGEQLVEGGSECVDIAGVEEQPRPAVLDQHRSGERPGRQLGVSAGRADQQQWNLGVHLLVRCRQQADAPGPTECAHENDAVAGGQELGAQLAQQVTSTDLARDQPSLDPHNF